MVVSAALARGVGPVRLRLPVPAVNSSRLIGRTHSSLLKLSSSPSSSSTTSPHGLRTISTVLTSSHSSCISTPSRQTNGNFSYLRSGSACSSSLDSCTHNPLNHRYFSSTSVRMVAEKIDGTAIAKEIRESIHNEIAERQKANSRFKPSLTIIQGMCVRVRVRVCVCVTIMAFWRGRDVFSGVVGLMSMCSWR